MTQFGQILDGKALANKIVTELHEKIIKTNNRRPKLVVVQVGNDSASNSYIKQKELMSVKAGIDFELRKLSAEIPENELITHIKNINNDNDIDGYLVQLPLPKHISPQKIVGFISPKKDVDGFHPSNMGSLFYNRECLAPCTPLGILLLLREYNIELNGKNISIIGASTIVGQPLSIMLTAEGATVTLCHNLTKNLSEIVNRSDIVISATGNPKALSAKNIKPGAIVIDVGINFDENGKITGDLNADDVKKIASYYTPVPGGVGPMTVAALLVNTWQAYQINLNAK